MSSIHKTAGWMILIVELAFVGLVGWFGGKYLG